MSIHKIGSDLIRPPGSNGTKWGPASSKATDAEELARVERVDRVDISPEGRELAAQLAADANGLTESRVEVLQKRIAAEFYDDPTIAARLAERMLAAGILDSA